VIQDRLSMARELMRAGQRRQALEEFARAAHTIADSRCPAHGGYPVWSGITEIVGGNWMGTVVNLSLMWDHSQSEQLDDLTPELEQEIVAAIQAPFLKVIGEIRREKHREIMLQGAQSEAERRYVELVYGTR
jgi:hypothetical protein